jgi:hypothetical protein
MDLTDSPETRQAGFRLSASRFGGRLWRGGVVVAAIVVASTGIAVASNAIKGASYTGSYAGTRAGTISFKVSANGKRVDDLTASTPFKCSGGCGGVPTPGAGSATISGKGKFKATLTLIGLGTSKKSIGTVTVTGTFLKHGEATGTVASHFDSSSADETVVWSAVGPTQTG